MQYFTIGGPLIPVYLTVDSTLITVDSTEITVDQTILASYPYVIRVLPRFISQDFRVEMLNELTRVRTTLTVDYFQYINEKLSIFFDYPFVEGDSVEIRVIDNITGSVMRPDKGYASAQTDTENYQLIPKNNNDIIIMD